MSPWELKVPLTSNELSVGGIYLCGPLGRGNSVRRVVLRRARSRIGAAVAVGLLAALLPTQAVAVPPGDDRNGVDLIDLQTEDTATDADTGDLTALTGEGTVEPTEYEPANTEAPAGGPGTADLASPTAGTLVRAGELPVLVGAPEDATSAEASALAGSWSVKLATPAQTQEADVDGALLTVTPPATASGEVEIALDYSDFEQLYSADWADRLEFVQRPACFLSTPDAEGCDEVTHLTTENDDDTGRITVTLDVDALTAASSSSTASTTAATSDGEINDGVYREDASDSGALKTLLPTATTASTGSAVLGTIDTGAGAKGDFTATPLASAGNWSAGGSSGAFTYSYKVTSPPSPRARPRPSPSRTTRRPSTAVHPSPTTRPPGSATAGTTAPAPSSAPTAHAPTTPTATPTTPRTRQATCAGARTTPS